MLKKTVLLLMMSLMTSSFPILALADQKTDQKDHTSSPDNYRETMLFIADRPFSSVDGTFFLNGIVGGDGVDFFKNVLGLSDEEIEESRQQAIAFYQQRFGLDVNDPRLYFTGFQIDPAVNYRAVMISGEIRRTPRRDGYPIVDGGWGLAVMDPEGVDLGGEFEGVHVPAGTLFAKGTYLIKGGKHGKDITVNYRSRGPMQPVGTGGVIDCEISHPDLGQGVAWGYFELHALPNNLTTAQVRNVLTFPAFGFEEAKVVTEE